MPCSLYKADTCAHRAASRCCADGWSVWVLSPTIAVPVWLQSILSGLAHFDILYNHTFLGLLAQIMCSICSYKLNRLYGNH